MTKPATPRSEIPATLAQATSPTAIRKLRESIERQLTAALKCKADLIRAGIPPGNVRIEILMSVEPIAIGNYSRDLNKISLHPQGDPK